MWHVSNTQANNRNGGYGGLHLNSDGTFKASASGEQFTGDAMDNAARTHSGNPNTVVTLAPSDDKDDCTITTKNFINNGDSDYCQVSVKVTDQGLNQKEDDDVVCLQVVDDSGNLITQRYSAHAYESTHEWYTGAWILKSAHIRG